MFNILYTFFNPTKVNFDIIINTHLKNWESYSESIRKNIKFILVDDCSKYPVNPIINFPINLTVARITDNIFWNDNGANNLGFKLCENDWIFRCDMDNLLSFNEFNNILNTKKEKENYYIGSRRLYNGTTKFKPFMNIFTIHYEDFWKTGGYDEEFSRHRGYSDWMLHALLEHYKIKHTQWDIITNQYEDFSVYLPNVITHGEGAVAHNRNLLEYKKKLLASNKYEHPDILNFNWEIVKEYKF